MTLAHVPVPTGPAPTVPPLAWSPAAATSRTADLDGPVHYVDHGGSGPVLVCVHGLGGSHANWHDLAPRLTARHRVLALDLAGHGRTPRQGRSAGVAANRELLDRFLAEVVREPAVLLGNSMGGTLAVLEAAAEPDRVRGLVLIGPASPGVRRELPDRRLARQVALCALPGLAERALVRRRDRLGAERLVQETFELTTADPGRVPDEVRRLAVELAMTRANGPDAEAAYLEAARSLVLLLARPARYRAAVAAVQVPALVLAGAEDRLVPLSTVRSLVALRPDWQLEVLDGVGHCPQVEAPAATAELVLDWLGQPQTLGGAA